MTKVKSKNCVKCGSANIRQNKGKFVCKDCGLGFCLFEGKNGGLSL